MATKLLIVEDETTLRETLAYNLTQEGYQVMQTGDGAKALELARADKFDLIGLDIMLPSLDGLSFCRILRKEQATPIIMLTARGGEVDRIVRHAQLCRSAFSSYGDRVVHLGSSVRRWAWFLR